MCERSSKSQLMLSLYQYSMFSHQVGKPCTFCSCIKIFVLPVSRTPIEIPMLDMNPVRSRACLQKGMTHIPNAVSSIEQPEKTENKTEGFCFSRIDVKYQENCDLNRGPRLYTHVFACFSHLNCFRSNKF